MITASTLQKWRENPPEKAGGCPCDVVMNFKKAKTKKWSCNPLPVECICQCTIADAG